MLETGSALTTSDENRFHATELVLRFRIDYTLQNWIYIEEPILYCRTDSTYESIETLSKE